MEPSRCAVNRAKEAPSRSFYPAFKPALITQSVRLEDAYLLKAAYEFRVPLFCSHQSGDLRCQFCAKCCRAVGNCFPRAVDQEYDSSKRTGAIGEAHGSDLSGQQTCTTRRHVAPREDRRSQNRQEEEN